MRFGTGSRSCPGQSNTHFSIYGLVDKITVPVNMCIDVAQAIMSKIIPAMFMHFEWSFEDPSAERKLVSKKLAISIAINVAGNICRKVFAN